MTEREKMVRTTPRASLLISIAIWVWALGVLAAYLYQFRDLIEPIKQLLLGFL